MQIGKTADLGRVIRTKRKALGLSQSQLAQFCGCGTRFVSDLEQGKPTVQFEKALDVASVLSLSIEAIDRAEEAGRR